MDKDDSNSPSMADLQDVEEKRPESKHGVQGKMANEGQQAGPNSDRDGEPIAPQMGDPRAKDRRPN